MTTRENEIYEAAEKATYQKPPQYSELVHKSHKVMCAYEVGFLDGADWADRTMIDKACEWFKEIACCGFIEDIEVGEFIEKFRKAMNMEENLKQLLLKDLCARLPYGLKVQVPKTISINALRVYAIEQMYQSTFYCKRNEWVCKFWNDTFARLDDIKPYLRPMSSMTAEEKEELDKLIFSESNHKEYFMFSPTASGIIYNGCDNCCIVNIGNSTIDMLVDWLNAHHFDSRNLIGRGLAIAVTNENNPYKD